jgi:rhodanese-related sulfurtransferase
VKLITSFILFVILLNVGACQTTPAKSKSDSQVLANKISPTDFELKLDSNAQLVDVRTKEEYAGGHLKHSKNINWNDSNFESEIQKLDKTQPVFVYCKSGGRSAKAAEKLNQLGFKNIFELEGGITAWINAGKLTTLKSEK